MDVLIKRSFDRQGRHTYHADQCCFQTKHLSLRARVSGVFQIRDPDLEILHGIPKQEEEGQVGHIPRGVRPEIAEIEIVINDGQPDRKRSKGE